MYVTYGKAAHFLAWPTVVCSVCSQRSQSTGSVSVRPFFFIRQIATYLTHALAHFSENWGFVSLAPMIGGNIFSIAFGRNLDAHAPSEPASNSTLTVIFPTLADAAHALATRAGDDSSHQCLQGRECYIDSLRLTTAACALAFALSVYAGWRDYRGEKRKMDVLESCQRGHVPREVVVWDVEE
jgi:hypothetical protein